MIWALFFVAITAGMMISHSLEMQSNRREMDVRYRQKSLATNIAQSGLTDATAWFRRQVSQPVTAFDPALDATGDPPVFDTIDPTKGLVREFEVRGSLWGRYEVRHEECIDVSAQSGQPTGSVWDVGVRGILYEVVDKSRPFDQYPNRVVATRALRTEVRGIPLSLPAQGGVVATDPTKVILRLGASILGDATYPALVTKTALPLAEITGELAGTPNSVSLPGMRLDTESVFGMRNDRLKALADVVATDGKSLVGRPIEDKLVYVDGDLVLAKGEALTGRMVLFVNGSADFQPGNDSNIAGVVVVQNKTYLHGPFQLRGTLIATMDVLVQGNAQGPATVEHDPLQVSRVTGALRGYRKSRDVRPTGQGSDGAFTVVGR